MIGLTRFLLFCLLLGETAAKEVGRMMMKKILMLMTWHCVLFSLLVPFLDAWATSVLENVQVQPVLEAPYLDSQCFLPHNTHRERSIVPSDTILCLLLMSTFSFRYEKFDFNCV